MHEGAFYAHLVDYELLAPKGKALADVEKAAEGLSGAQAVSIDEERFELWTPAGEPWPQGERKEREMAREVEAVLEILASGSYVEFFDEDTGAFYFFERTGDVTTLRTFDPRQRRPPFGEPDLVPATGSGWIL